MKPKSNKRISYLQQRSKCKEFLLGFEDFDSKSLDPDYGRKKYLVKLVNIVLFSKKLQMKILNAQIFSMKIFKASLEKKMKNHLLNLLEPIQKDIPRSSHKLPMRLCPREERKLILKM